MPKKFFDIVPPKKAEEYRNSTFLEKLTQPIEKRPPSFLKKVGPVLKKRKQLGKGTLVKVLIFFSGILIIAGVFSCFFLKETQIEIWPAAEVLSFKENFKVDTALEVPDYSEKIVLGKFLEEEKSLFRQFSSTGKTEREVKAEGIIRVYNNFSESIGLVANTRFLSAEGKLFRSTERAYIPAGGFSDLKVLAAEAGEDYNVKPSTFSVPGLVGYPSYTAVYGKSFSQMEGGFRGESLKVSEGDLKEAESILIEELKEENKKNLENRAKDFVLLEDAIDHEVLEASSLTKAGAEVEQFSYLVKTRSKALVFSKEELETFAKEFILANIDSGEKMDQESFEINYSLKSVDFKEGNLLLSLDFSARVFSEINLEELKEELKGSTELQVKNLLENKENISRAKVKFWPFWLKKVPENVKKIKIELKVD
ncbi:hypothetical protein ACFL0A_01730 [Patescibacteria group bacterium]